MSTQLGLQFGSESAALRVETANLEHCIRCGAPREGSKPGSVCGGKCRIERSMARRKLEAEGYLADRPPPTEPEALRDQGKAIAASNHRPELIIGQWAALRCIGERGPSTVSHVREWCAARGIVLEWAKNWTGSLFHPHQDPPWFRHTGRYLQAFHEGSRCRAVKEWALTGEGERVYLQTGGVTEDR